MWACWKSASPSQVKPWSSRRRRARSARWSGRSPRSRDAARSASRADRTSALRGGGVGLRCLRGSSRGRLRPPTRSRCPAGIDVYFENVGGAVQQTVWPLLNDFARVPVCGLISQYSATTPMPGPDMFSVLRKRLTLRGFIVWDYAARQADFLRDMGEWVGGGRVKYREDVVEGLENAPAAFLGLLQGKNFGKLLVKVE